MYLVHRFLCYQKLHSKSFLLIYCSFGKRCNFEIIHKKDPAPAATEPVAAAVTAEAVSIAAATTAVATTVRR